MKSSFAFANFFLPFAMMVGVAACFEAGGGEEDMSALALALVQNGAGSGDTNTCILKRASTPAGTAVADTVISAPAQTGVGFGAKECLTNGVRGEGSNAGSLDVFSMTSTGDGAIVILAWDGLKITNGSGIDFVVFENAFVQLGSPGNSFMEQVIVEVTENDTTRAANQWCGFAPDYTNAPETTYSRAVGNWSNFAGLTAVKYNQDSNPLSASAIFDQSQAGGDGFNLDNLSSSDSVSPNCSAGVRSSILANGFVYIRLQSATNVTNPDTAATFVSDSSGGTPDIDGVIARYTASR